MNTTEVQDIKELKSSIEAKCEDDKTQVIDVSGGIAWDEEELVAKMNKMIKDSLKEKMKAAICQAFMELGKDVEELYK